MMLKLDMWCLVFLVIVSWTNSLVRASALLTVSMELCGPETDLELTKTGETSSMVVALTPPKNGRICKMRVTAPKTHVINMQFMDTTKAKDVPKVLEERNSERNPPCVMNIFLPDNPRTPVWKGDICGRNPVTDVDLLTPDIKIVWNSPENATHIRGRRFVITAVGKGPICKDSSQHTCMRIGWDPMLCVADHLLCDGIQNCPKSASSSDEDEKMCKSHLLLAQTSWEQFAVEIFKKLRPPSDLVNNNKWLHEKLEQHAPSSKKAILDWRERDEVTENQSKVYDIVMAHKYAATTQKPTSPKPPKATDSISQVLSKYGPWGYLMLGMLMCGTVLMFCGLWECCFKKPKNQGDPPSPSSCQSQPTTVLIINQEEINIPQPPNYDDLDQPPAYTTLFPSMNRPKEESGIPPAASTSTVDNENNNTRDSVVVVVVDDGDDNISRVSEYRVDANET